MKKILYSILLLSIFLEPSAQVNTNPIRAGLFSSFYLDSAFDGSGNYKLNDNFPRQAIAGLEFYEGVVMAIDSINASGVSAKLEVYDTKSKQGNIEKLSKHGKFDSLDLMLFHGGLTEYLKLEAISKQKKIPLISASYPNDGGVRRNPLVFIANPTIKTHLEVIVEQLGARWENSNIIWFNRSDLADSRLAALFNEIIQNTKLKENIKHITLDPSFSSQDLANSIDTTKNNVLIAGSLDNNFAVNFARAVSLIEKKGIIQVVGLPNWDGLKEIQSPVYVGIPIYFSSEMSAAKYNQWANNFEERFKEVTGVQSSRSAIKGFELTFYFLNLLSKQGSILINDSLSQMFILLNEFDFKPVRLTDDSTTPDYIENKKVYFIRRLNGVESNQ